MISPLGITLNFATLSSGAKNTITVGAIPTAEHLAKVDLSAADVYVVGAEMTQSNNQTYTLTWDDTPGENPRTQNYTVGIKAFKTPAAGGQGQVPRPRRRGRRHDRRDREHKEVKWITARKSTKRLSITA